MFRDLSSLYAGPFVTLPYHTSFFQVHELKYKSVYRLISLVVYDQRKVHDIVGQ